jgi:hypothetical protein
MKRPNNLHDTPAMMTRLIQSIITVLALSPVLAADPPPKPVELKVSVVGASTQRSGIVVRFENRSEKPIRLLRPLDGSEWGWHMPVYDLSITDAAGKAIPPGIRCKFSGLYSDMKWPDDYRIQILPGDAYEMTVSFCREIPSSGRYSVSFRYTYDLASKTARQHPNIKYPDDLWTGTATSASATVEITK